MIPYRWVEFGLDAFVCTLDLKNGLFTRLNLFSKKKTPLALIVFF